MSDGFLGRWARRKEAVRAGKVVEAEPVAASVTPVPLPQPSPRGGGSVPDKPPPPPGEGGGGGTASQPPPTLADVEALTPDADFGRFVRPDVAPEVKNAALKKLFSDPHFNVMDRLDTYIDDYNTPDPLPPEMLRKLASAEFLGLFRDEEKSRGEGREVADEGAGQTVAQSAADDPVPPPGDAVPEERSAACGAPEHPVADDCAAIPRGPQDHADPDLRLQQDDAPGPRGPGESAR